MFQTSSLHPALGVRHVRLPPPSSSTALRGVPGCHLRVALQSSILQSLLELERRQSRRGKEARATILRRSRIVIRSKDLDLVCEVPERVSLSRSRATFLEKVGEDVRDLAERLDLSFLDAPR